MPQRMEEDSTSSLEHAREGLYSKTTSVQQRPMMHDIAERTLPHTWEEKDLSAMSHQGKRHVKFATIFLLGAVVFFFVSLAVAGYFFYYGTNSVSPDKVIVDIQGPKTIAGGDTVPFAFTITNKNPVAIENVTIEITFPEGTKSAEKESTPYPRYVENLGTLASGATVTRSAKAVIFGGAGQTLNLPVSVSYGTESSNAVFEKKYTRTLSISSTPLSVSVDSLTEAVSGEPITFNLNVRSNATRPTNNVVLIASAPFGFSVTSSSVPMVNSGFLLGTLAPGESKNVTLTGTLTGQNNEQRVFHFTVGTAKSAQSTDLALSYMKQDATVTIAAPFISTTLTVNGDASPSVVIAPESLHSVSVSYVNTLSTTISNVAVSIAVAGSAIDYNSIKTSNGFYNSTNHTIVFGQDVDPALAMLAPGASGLGVFTFATLPAGTATSPDVTFTVSVSGMRTGQTNVPEQVTASTVKTAKVSTTVLLAAASSHNKELFGTAGPIPPHTGEPTTYAVIWNVQNKGSAVAGGTVKATLPGYVVYTGQTSGVGSMSYDNVSHVVTWTVGDLAQGASAKGAFEVSLTPSTSQLGAPVTLVNKANFSGYDRFAGVQVSAASDYVTTETKGDAGYVPGSGTVR